MSDILKNGRKFLKRGEKIEDFSNNLNERTKTRYREEEERRLKLLKENQEEYVRELSRQKGSSIPNFIEDVKGALKDTFFEE